MILPITNPEVTSFIKTNELFCSIFDRSSTFFALFAQILEYFVILWFRRSLDMFTSLDKFVELYQFASEVLELQYKSEHV